ncbi:MAG: hypothetical protein A3E82_03045 [Gammaproteobacteria bacterium RIFCSPHIGHO2_12_FULL_38_11]|nr:MAG: hypothetical protein A3E82_03045 [Gammaproteobacteria bacterium RIFCSPHIGHO2_12_FULL_38_11]
MLDYNPRRKKFSQQLRNNMTDAEKLLWRYVRYKQLCDIQFYRQKPIGNYIVDFYAPAVKLVVEIDGGQHFLDEGLRKDHKRDVYLSSLNLKVLRFDNWQILKSVGDVLNEIHRQIEIRIFSK